MLLKSTGVPLLADIQHPNMAFDYTFNGDELHNLGDSKMPSTVKVNNKAKQGSIAHV